MFKHILISTDGSAASNKATKAGVALASAIEPLQPIYAESYAFDEKMIEGIEEYVRQTGQRANESSENHVAR